MNWETIICLGDSITIGARSLLGYPEYCGDELSKLTNKHWNAVNHATSGYKTIDLCRCVAKNFASLKMFKPEIITIMIGTNDLKSKTSVADFKIAYDQLIIKSRLIIGNNDIMLIKIPPLIEGVMLPYKMSMNKMILDFNKMIEDIAEREGFTITEFDSIPGDFYDGVHLNDAGSKKWGEILAQNIIKSRMQLN